MKHSRFPRVFILLLFVAFLLPTLALFHVSASTYDLDFATVGAGQTSIGSDDVKWLSYSVDKLTVAEGVTTIEPQTFAYFELGSVQLPSTLKTIDSMAFAGCTLASVTIPDSVTEIGDSAFDDCENLRSVKLGKGLKTIGAYAFNGCESLIWLSIPENVTSIGECAFSSCSLLTTVYYNAKNCADIDGSFGAFGYQNTINEIVIGLNVERIPSNAFSDSVKLTSLTIPANVKTIGKEAFSGCTALAELNLEEGLLTVEAYAFEHCSSLKEVTIPNSVTKLDSTAFWYCNDIVIHAENPDLLPSYGDDYGYEAPENGWDKFARGIATGFGVAAVVVIIILLLIVLCALTVEIIVLVGNLKLTNRYRSLTGKRVGSLKVLSVILTLLGLGIWYMVVIAILNHSEANKAAKIL